MSNIDHDPQQRLIHTQQQAIKFSTSVAYVLANLRFHSEPNQDCTLQALPNGTLTYQPDYVLAMPIGLLVTHLYHAVLHVGLQESLMSQGHNPRKYRIGFETKCTQIQDEAGLSPIFGSQRMIEWDHCSIETILDQIPEVTEEQAIHACPLRIPLTFPTIDLPEFEEGETEDGKNGISTGSIMTATLTNAASLAKSIGEGSAGLHLLIDKLREPQVTWRELLRYAAGQHLGKKGRSFKRPHRRSGAVSHALGQTVILPGKNRELDSVIVVFDLSSSVVDDRRMVEDCCAELDAILSLFKHPCRVIFHESHVTDDFEAEKLTDVLDRLIGGGGTQFIPVYQHLAASEKPISLVIWITDLFGTHWDAPPPFPIIWLTGHNHDTPPPWGQLVSLPPSLG